MHYRKNYKEKISALEKKFKFKFKVGDIVRISKLKKLFQRYYSEHWTNELFIIKKRKIKENIPTYTITDYAEDITGTFYEAELQQVFVDENTKFNVEKVLKKKKTRKE